MVVDPGTTLAVAAGPGERLREHGDLAGLAIILDDLASDLDQAGKAFHVHQRALVPVEAAVAQFADGGNDGIVHRPEVVEDQRLIEVSLASDSTSAGTNHPFFPKRGDGCVHDALSGLLARS